MSHMLRLMWRLLLPVMVLVSGCSPPAFVSVSPSLESFEPFYVPLRLDEHGIARVQVSTSAGELDLILDTGADHAILLFPDSPVITKLERIGSQTNMNARGSRTRSPVYAIDELTLGSLHFTTVRAGVDEVSAPRFMRGDGVLGRGLLNGVTLDIDGPNQRLGILPPGSIVSADDRHTWPAADLLETHNGPVVAVRIDESDHVLRMVIDTGAIAFSGDDLYGLVELPDDLTAQPDLVQGEPVYDAKSVRVGQAELGPMKFFVVDHSQPPNTQGFLGNVMLRDWRVLIVPSEGRVYFRRQDSAKTGQPR